jgi:putative ABC transport system ATP-binding protein
VPTAGEVRLEGRALGTLGDGALTLLRRRRIGFVFQFFNLLPALTAEENVAVPLLLDGVARRELWPRVRAMLARVGLGTRCTHRPDELSGGEMQRVALARALVTAPAVVLADEPTGNLDATTAAGVLALLRDVGRALGQTTVVVTHDPKAAAAADRVVTLVAGRIVD